MDQRRALVTGATGFVGGHVARRLMKAGWNVHVLVRPSSDRRKLSVVQNSVDIHVHDGTTEGMLEIVRAADPHTIFHLAATGGAEHRLEDVVTLVQSNVFLGTQLV